MQRSRHDLSMKSKKAVRSAPITANGFKVGQMWRIGDVNLAVTSVGKRLVHYKRYKTQAKGIQTTLCSKPDLRKYLRSTRAILISA